MNAFEYHCREARKAIASCSLGALEIEVSKLMVLGNPHKLPEDIKPYLTITNTKTGEVRSIFA